MTQRIVIRRRVVAVRRSGTMESLREGDFERRAMVVDGVIELAVPREELIRRMLARKRADDNPAVFSKRITSFENQTAPLLDYYARQGKLASIDGLGNADDIFERVKEAVERFERRPGPRGGR